MKNCIVRVFWDFFFAEHFVLWLFFLLYNILPDWRHSSYHLLLITVLEGHGRVSVHDLIKYALSRKSCFAKMANVINHARSYKITLSLLDAHNARQCTTIVLRDQSTVLYTQLPPTLLYLVWMYNNVLTARVTVVTQKGIGRCIIVVGELLYNTLLVPVLTRFLGGGWWGWGAWSRWRLNLCFT